jgi:hypothetical protein
VTSRLGRGISKSFFHIAAKKRRKLTFIRDESIVVLRVAALLDEDVHLLTL